MNTRIMEALAAMRGPVTEAYKRAQEHHWTAETERDRARREMERALRDMKRTISAYIRRRLSRVAVGYLDIDVRAALGFGPREPQTFCHITIRCGTVLADKRARCHIEAKIAPLTAAELDRCIAGIKAACIAAKEASAREQIVEDK